VQTYTRRQLKHDRFQEATAEGIHWADEHRKTLILAAVVVIMLAALGFGAYFYQQQREAQASEALGNAVQIMNAPIVAANTPGIPEGAITFTTAADREKAANKAFNDVAEKFGRTENGKYARYMAGVTALSMGDTANGEKQLQDAASSSSKRVSVLAKMALASYYRANNRDADALNMYKQVIDANSSVVPRPVAQFELESFYESRQQKSEAIKVLQQIESEATDKTSSVFDLAQQKLQTLGVAPAPPPTPVAAKK